MLVKELGKIQYVDFGLDADGRFGFRFSLVGPGWGVQDFWGVNTQPSTDLVAWNDGVLVATLRVREVLKEAKEYRLEKLLDIPVEVTFDDGTLKSWRILTEVL
jgi:hypothetical protein